MKERLLAPSGLSSKEALFAGIAAIVLFLFHLSTADLFPLQWCDETLLSDAGVNLHLGRGFTSTAWPDQGSGEFFGGNMPLYPAVLCGWLNLWGFSTLSWRAFTFFCSSAGIYLLYLTVRQAAIVKQPMMAVLFVVAFLFNSPGMQVMRGMRYDGFHLLLLALTLWIWLRPTSRIQCVGISTLGALLFASGVQVAVYAGLLSLISLYCHRRDALRKIVVLASGMFFGAGVVFLVWWSHGALNGFLGNIALTRKIELEQGSRIATFLFRIFIQPMQLNYLPLLLLAYVVAAWPLNRLKAWVPLLGLLVLAVLLQLGIHFRMYYHWYVIGPLALAIAVALEGRPQWRKARTAGVGVLLLILFLNGPVKLLLFSWALDLTSRRQALEEFAKNHLSSSDVLVSEYIAYTSVVAVARKAYFPHYLARMPLHEVSGVTAVLMQPTDRGFQINNSPVNTAEWMRRSEASWRFVADVPAPKPKRLWLALTKLMPGPCARFEYANDLFRLTLFRRENQ